MEPHSDPPDFHAYAWIVVNHSGGKDSQAALQTVLSEAGRQKYPLERIVLSHQCLGRMEWHGTKELIREEAARYGLRLEITSYRDKDGNHMNLLDAVRRRGKWPSNNQRYCTSEHKRGPGNRVLTMLSKERPGAILQIFGFRAEESPARAKKKVFAPNPRASSKSRPVTDWLPIHDWLEDQVWQTLKDNNVRRHYAYDLGMPRLSCCFCIFAPKGALMVAAKNNPELFEEYLAVEKEIEHDFQNKKPLRLIKEALDKGEATPEMTGTWNM